MPANMYAKSSWNLISDTITRITFLSTNGTPFRCYLGGMAVAIELSHGIAEISGDPDKRTCIQIRTPLNSPLLGFLKALPHLLYVIEHFKDRAGIPTPLFLAQLKLTRKLSFLARITIYIKIHFSQKSISICIHTVLSKESVKIHKSCKAPELRM